MDQLSRRAELRLLIDQLAELIRRADALGEYALAAHLSHASDHAERRLAREEHD